MYSFNPWHQARYNQILWIHGIYFFIQRTGSWCRMVLWHGEKLDMWKSFSPCKVARTLFNTFSRCIKVPPPPPTLSKEHISYEKLKLQLQLYIDSINKTHSLFFFSFYFTLCGSPLLKSVFQKNAEMPLNILAMIVSFHVFWDYFSFLILYDCFFFFVTVISSFLRVRQLGYLFKFLNRFI